MRRMLLSFILVVTLFLTFSGASGANSGSTGPQPFASVVDDASFGESPWLDAGNASLCDGVRAETTLSASQFRSQYLRATNARLTVPTTATVSGFEVALDVQTVGTGPTLAFLYLIRNGVRASDSRTAWLFPDGTSRTYILGTPEDLWNAGWTPSETNADDFGALVWAYTYGSGTVRVDCLSITAYYSIPTVYYLPLLSAP